MFIKDHNLSVGSRPFFCAEIGINHNGNIEEALQLVQEAKNSGADAVKFQKRYPPACVPKEQWYEPQSTPWGFMNYIEYCGRMEFSTDEYRQLSDLCDELGLVWFASVWDAKSVRFFHKFDLPVYKIGSATLTDDDVLDAVSARNKPVILSTGMSTEEEIHHAVSKLLIQRADRKLMLCHSVAVYPTPKRLLNFKMIPTLRSMYPDIAIGYSGHEEGWQMTALSIPLGATYIERHITLDRDSWGSDHKASLLPKDFRKMVTSCKAAWQALGDGEKLLLPEEEPAHRKLRKPVPVDKLPF